MSFLFTLSACFALSAAQELRYECHWGPPSRPPNPNCFWMVVVDVTGCRRYYEECNASPRCTRKNEVYYSCSSKCEPTCDVQNSPCTTDCGPAACQCAFGFVRDRSGNCLSSYQCNNNDVTVIETNTTCSENEEFVQCSSLCEPSCSQRNRKCTRDCGPPRCQCKKSFFRYGGDCISPIWCPPPPRRCFHSGDCYPWMACEDGFCRQIPSVKQCSHQWDCGPTMTCFMGRCQPPPTCFMGRCEHPPPMALPTCRYDTECPPGFACYRQFCERRQMGYCTSNFECPSTSPICTETGCRSLKCKVDNHCPMGTHCWMGQCQGSEPVFDHAFF